MLLLYVETIMSVLSVWEMESCSCLDWLLHVLNELEGEMTYVELKTRVSGVKIQTLEGKDLPLESLWKDRRIVLAFLRHFG